MDNFENFQKYDSNSNEITLYYNLAHYFPEYQKWRNLNLSYYGHNFSSIVKKNYFSGYETFKKSDTLIEMKKRISKLSGFPIETFVKFGTKGGTEYNPNDGTVWNNINDYNVDESISISNSNYNSPIVENRYVYLYVDSSKSKIFESLK